jgi:hypothetical protein
MRNARRHHPGCSSWPSRGARQPRPPVPVAHRSSIDDRSRPRPRSIRFHASRGSMSLGEGRWPATDSVVESPEVTHRHRPAIDAHHDPAPGRCTVGGAVPPQRHPDLMRSRPPWPETAGCACTHISPRPRTSAFTMERFGKRLMDTPLTSAGSTMMSVCPRRVRLSRGDRQHGRHWHGRGPLPDLEHAPCFGNRPVSAYLAAGYRSESEWMARRATTGATSRRGAPGCSCPVAVAPGIGAGPQMAARTALRWRRGGATVLGRDDVGSLRSARPTSR